MSKELSTLRPALELARARRIYRGSVQDVVPKLSVDYTPRDRYLANYAELDALCVQLAPRRALWVLVAVYTGGRASEVSKLDWADVNWAASPSTVHLRGKKTKASNRTIPLAAELARRLGPVRQVNGPIVGAWSNCRRDLAAACKRAGIARVSPNDFRRTFASWLKNRGVDSAVLARLLGHSSTKMVDLVYGKIEMATLVGAMSLLDGNEATTARLRVEGRYDLTGT